MSACVCGLVHNVLDIFLLYSSLSLSIHIQVSTDNDFSRINFIFFSATLRFVLSHINLFARIIEQSQENFDFQRACRHVRGKYAK